VREWHNTACNLCYVNCGLEVQTDGRAITRIRGDNDRPPNRGLPVSEAAAADLVRRP